MEGEARGDAGEVVEHGVHAGRVEGVADAQAGGLAAERLEVRGERDDGVFVAGDDGGRRGH